MTTQYKNPWLINDLRSSFCRTWIVKSLYKIKEYIQLQNRGWDNISGLPYAYKRQGNIKDLLARFIKFRTASVLLP